MALNLKPKRKLILGEDFAMGWEDCYLVVRSVSDKERDELIKGEEQARGEGAEAYLREKCIELITGGVVLSTNDDGSTETVNVTPADIPDVVDALNVAWKQEVLFIATGLDRLKANMN